jgi:hypothetical protein
MMVALARFAATALAPARDVRVSKLPEIAGEQRLSASRATLPSASGSRHQQRAITACVYSTSEKGYPLQMNSFSLALDPPALRSTMPQ